LPDSAAIESTFADCDLKALSATSGAVERSLGHVEAIESILTEKVGSTQAVNFGDLSKTLKSAHRVLAERLSRRGVATATPEGEVTVETQGHAGQAGETGQAASGEIRSREEAVRLLDRACEYFQRHEPSSPVPLLLRRAKRLVSKSFVEIVRDLAPEGLPQVEKIRGEGDES
jgi:type VI secretion system protein ImpA